MGKYALIIPTLNGGELWHKSVQMIRSQQPLVEKVLVIDSGSMDDTVQIAESAGFDVHSIPVSEFGHGRTRQLAVDMLKDFEILVFMTQDALLADDGALSRIVEPFASNPRLAAVCGRQLPHEDAGLFARHLRTFNYPPKSHVYSMGDITRQGMRAAFMSNSFAAYRRSLLIDVGGFPEHVIMGEDTYVAARMLLKDYQLAYNADACVYHSHNYSLLDEFKRYFDTGVFHSREVWFQARLGKPEGMKYVKSEFQYIARHSALLLPEMGLRILCKYMGYKLGFYGKYLPVSLKRRLSMNAGYWY